MSTRAGYQPPTVTVASSLPSRGVGKAVLIVPVVSTGDEDEPGAAAVVAAEPFLGHDAVAEIENGCGRWAPRAAPSRPTGWWYPRCRWAACSRWAGQIPRRVADRPDSPRRRAPPER
ncbi:putative cytosol aminopeptidase domain protein [Mycobacterium xenopi 3993]|nr:putative cytosol aminopeptidase domain protein [Mycobacterium xenopi 3993]